MSDDVPRIQLGLSDTGQPVVLLGTLGDTADSMPALLHAAPGLTAPSHAADLALAANHLAHGSDYRVITDPHDFEAAYRARLSREDPAAPWQEGVIRLRDFGVPDFGAIAAPRFAAGRLVFYAADAFLGVPYQAELSDMVASPEYKPVPLDPVDSLPAPPPPDPEPERTPLTQEERDARQTHMPGDLSG